RGRRAAQERGRRDQHARGAEAALHAAVLEERLLQRAQPAPPGKPLDGRDAPALRLQREVRARVHRLVVEQDHARPALGVVAALLRPRQTDVLANRTEERRVRIELDRVVDAVHGERGGDLHRARSSAACTARRAITAAIADRYAAEPRTSEMGRDAAATASPSASSVSAPPVVPARISSASGTRRTVGASAVIATRASATRPPSRRTSAATPTTAISIWRR